MNSGTTIEIKPSRSSMQALENQSEADWNGFLPESWCAARVLHTVYRQETDTQAATGENLTVAPQGHQDAWAERFRL